MMAIQTNYAFEKHLGILVSSEDDIQCNRNQQMLMGIE